MKYSILILTFLLFTAGTAFAQAKKPAAKPAQKAVSEPYTLYTIENGVKTKVNDLNADITLPIGPSGYPQKNLLVEINVPAFHKKYPYDYVYFRVFNHSKDDYFTDAPFMNFIDQGQAKKMATMTTMRILFFKEKGEEYEDCQVLKNLSDPLNVSFAADTFQFQIRGAYSEGEETYYDEYSQSVKSRQIYKDWAKITNKPAIRFRYDATYLKVTSNKILRNRLRYGDVFQQNGKSYVPAGNLTKLYKNATNYPSNFEVMAASKLFIERYMNARLATIEKMEDDIAAIEAYAALAKETEVLNMTNLTTDQKKDIDRQVKKLKADVPDETILAIFRNGNPNAPALETDYASLIAR